MAKSFKIGDRVTVVIAGCREFTGTVEDIDGEEITVNGAIYFTEELHIMPSDQELASNASLNPTK